MENDLFNSQQIESITFDDIFFDEIGGNTANNVFKANHYAHRKVQIVKAFGVFLKDDMITLKGCISFGKPANNSLCIGVCGKESSNRVYELNRLWLDDSLPKNCESKLIGYALRMLKKEFKKWIIVSYADTAMNHTGAIYRATNFIYTGLSDERKCGDYASIDGKHNRHLVKSDLPNRPRSRKHRYVYFLDKKDEKNLRYKRENFVKSTLDNG
jgi:hypothetical protein